MSTLKTEQPVLHGKLHSTEQGLNAKISTSKQKLNTKLSTSGGDISINYERLRNKPQIESVELIGNKTLEELGIINIPADELARILV